MTINTKHLTVVIALSSALSACSVKQPDIQVVSLDKSSIELNGTNYWTRDPIEAELGAVCKKLTKNKHTCIQQDKLIEPIDSYTASILTLDAKTEIALNAIFNVNAAPDYKGKVDGGIEPKSSRVVKYVVVRPKNIGRNLREPLNADKAILDRLLSDNDYRVYTSVVYAYDFEATDKLTGRINVVASANSDLLTLDFGVKGNSSVKRNISSDSVVAYTMALPCFTKEKQLYELIQDRYGVSEKCGGATYLAESNELKGSE